MRLPGAVRAGSAGAQQQGGASRLRQRAQVVVPPLEEYEKQAQGKNILRFPATQSLTKRAKNVDQTASAGAPRFWPCNGKSTFHRCSDLLAVNWDDS